MLMTGASKVRMGDEVPLNAVTVRRNILSVADAVSSAPHATLVDDVHVDVAQVSASALAVAVASIDPNPRPLTVSVAMPSVLPALEVALCVRAGASNEMAGFRCVPTRVSTFNPTESSNTEVVTEPWQEREVADVQLDVVHGSFASSNVALSCMPPKLKPVTVAHVDADGARFEAGICERTGASKLKGEGVHQLYVLGTPALLSWICFTDIQVEASSEYSTTKLSLSLVPSWFSTTLQAAALVGLGSGAAARSMPNQSGWGAPRLA